VLAKSSAEQVTNIRGSSNAWAGNRQSGRGPPDTRAQGNRQGSVLRRIQEDPCGPMSNPVVRHWPVVRCPSTLGMDGKPPGTPGRQGSFFRSLATSEKASTEIASVIRRMRDTPEIALALMKYIFSIPREVDVAASEKSASVEKKGFLRDSPSSVLSMCRIPWCSYWP
jgi:hypothetical protein